MINWFKKHFIPHEGNGHRPHFLHRKNTLNVILVILFLEIFTFLIPTLTNINKTGGMAAVLPAVLASLTNEERQAQNLIVLTTNPTLVKAAELKAKDMATKSYFAHTSPEGKTPWYWLNQVGYKYQYAGENLAVNFTDSKDVTNAWMNSPTHKANIVKDKYTEVGTGIANGVFEGREAVFVVQLYANPLIIKQNVVASKKVEIKKDIINTNFKNPEEPAKILGEKNVLGTEIEEGITEEKIISNPEIIPEQKSQDPTFLQKAFASPRNTTNIILNVVFGIITIVLILYIVIKKRNHHKDLIVNGLLVIAILGALFIANYYISNHNTYIVQSLDYSNEDK
jgi:hypothetical protein